MSHEYDVGGGQVFNLLFISQVLAEGLSTGKEIERPPILFKLWMIDFDILLKKKKRSIISFHG